MADPRIASQIDIDILIGAGDIELARGALIEAAGAEMIQEIPNVWFVWTLADIYWAEGNREMAEATLEHYIPILRRNRFGAASEGDLNRKLVELRAGSELAEFVKQRLAPRSPDQRVDEGALFQPLPDAPQGNVRFVLIGGPMHCVDRRGEFLCVSGETIQSASAEATLAEECSRTICMVESQQWSKATISLTNRLVENAVRLNDTNDRDSWTYSTGFTTGAFRDLVKELIGRSPTRERDGSTSFEKPARGRWLYGRTPPIFAINCLRDKKMLTVKSPPEVVVWRWPDRSDVMLQAVCDTFGSNAAHPITVVLPDSPGLRSFAKRYVSKHSMLRAERTLLENSLYFATDAPNQRGTVCHARFAPTLVIEPDGTQWSGENLAAALDFLDANYLLRISPWDLVKDPLLRQHMSTRIGEMRIASERSAPWTDEETDELERMREWYGWWHWKHPDESRALYSAHLPSPLMRG